MPNDQKPIKSSITRKQDLDNKPLKKAGDGTMGLMLWSIAGTVIAACSSPIFSDVADLAGGGGSSGDTQGGPTRAVTNGRWANTDIYVVDENGNRGPNAVGITDGAGNIIFNDEYIDLGTLGNGEQYIADLDGATEISTDRQGGSNEELLSLPYNGGDLIISPLTDLLANAYIEAGPQQDMTREEFQQVTLDAIFGVRPQFDATTGDAITGTEDSVVTVEDVFNADNYNPFVDNNIVTELVSLASTTLGLIETEANNTSATERVQALTDSFDDNRGKLITEANEDDLSFMLDSDSSIGSIDLDALVEGRIADTKSRPVVTIPENRDPIRMTEDQDFTLVSGNAEVLFGFDDPFGNDEDGQPGGQRVDGQLVGIYIQAASTDSNVNVMFRNAENTIVGLASVQGADRGVVAGTPTPHDSTFFYVSEANFDRLVLSPDANFNTENNPNPEIRFYVYDGEDVTPETGIGKLEVEVVAVNDAPEITPPTAPVAIDNSDIDVSGRLTVSDADDGDDPSIDPSITWRATGNTDYGSIVFSPNPSTDNIGRWTFRLNAEAFDALPDGQDVSREFIVTADDGNGGVSDPVTLTIEIQGQNDAPTDITTSPLALSAEYVGNSIPEDGIFIAALGTDDPDAGDAHIYSIAGAGAVADSFSLRNSDAPGAITSDTATENIYLWLDRDAATREVGQTWDITIISEDSASATTSPIPFSITRADSNTILPPVISDFMGSIRDDDSGDDENAPDPVSGIFTASGNVEDWAAVPQGTEYGTIAVNGDEWTFTLNDVGIREINRLDGDDRPAEAVFEVTATNQGGDDTAFLRIRLIGINDASDGDSANPVLGEAEDPVPVKTAKEAGHELDNGGVTVIADSIVAMGSFTHTDENDDQGDFVGGTVHIKAASAPDSAYGAGLGIASVGNEIDGVERGTPVTGTYGIIHLRDDGNWYYVLDDANSDVNALPEGASSLVDLFDVRIQETENSAVVSNVLRLEIMIAGTNDRPTDIQATLEGTTEAVTDNALVATYNGNVPPAEMVVATLTTSDPDTGDTHMYSITGADMNSFRISGNELQFASGDTETVNRNPGETWTVDVTSTDSRGISVTQTFTIERAGNAYPVFNTEASEDYDATNERFAEKVTDDNTHSPITMDNPTATGMIVAEDFETATGDITYSARQTDGTEGLGNVVFVGNAWTFTLTDPAGITALNALRGSTTEVLTYEITASDGNGGTATTDLRITLEGATDDSIPDPDIDAPNSGLEGTIIDDDADAHDNTPPTPTTGTIILTSLTDIEDLMWNVAMPSVSGLPEGVAENTDFGTLTFPGSEFTEFDAQFVGGTTRSLDWEFTPTNAINALSAAHEDVTLTYEITARNRGGSDDGSVANLVINLNGVNDKPVLALNVDDGAVIEAGGLGNADTGDTAADGNFSITDPDVGQDDFAPSGNTLEGRSGTSGVYETDGLIEGIYGTLTLNNSTGAWTYALRDDDPDTQALDGGDTPDTEQDVFNIRLVNNDGTNTQRSEPVTLTIDVTGANDAPTITSTDSNQPPFVDASATDHIGSASAPQMFTGTAVASDVDANDGDGANGADDFTWSIVGDAATTDYGTLVFDNSGVGGGWTFTTNAVAFNTIAHGQQEMVTYSVQAEDPQNALSAAMDLTFMLEGVNDRPVLAVTGNNAGVTEAGGANNAVAGTASAIGGFTITDPDEHSGINQNSIAFDGNTLQGRFESTGDFTNATDTDPAMIEGVYGDLTLEADGTWTYTLDNMDTATQALRGARGSTLAQTEEEEFEIRLENVDGTTERSAIETITITVTGANDDPVITSDSVMDHLITTVPGSSTVPGSRTVTGMFESTDVDTGDTATWSVDTSTSGEGSYGSLSVDSNTGAWTFTFLDGTDGEDAFNALSARLSLAYKVTATDLSGRDHEVDFNIVLQGADDSPVLGESPNPVKTAIEAGHEVAGTAAMGSFTHTDTDAGQGGFVGGTVHVKADGVGDDDLAVANAAYAAGLGNNAGNNIIDGTDRGTAVTGTYGTIYLRADGDWYYVLDNANTDVNALPDGASALEDVFDVRIQETVDSTIVSNVLELRIAITGTNDAPTDITASSITATYNGNAPTADMVVATLTTSDPDDSSGHTYALDMDSADANSFRINNNQLLFASDVTEADNRNPGDDWTVGVTSTDSRGASLTRTFTITRAGNAFPVITEANPTDGILLEVSITDMDTAHDNRPAAVNDTTDGSFVATDADTSDTITWSSTGVSINRDMTTGTEFDERPPGDFGSLMVNGDGTWSFTPSVTINQIGAAQTVVIDYDIQASDGNSGTDTSILRVMLTGVNDNPEITTDSGIFLNGITIIDPPTNVPTGDVPTPVTSSGGTLFAATDIDGDSVTWAPVTPMPAGSLVAMGSINAASTTDVFDSRTASEFGVLTITDANTGAWSFAPTATINQIGATQTVVIDYDIQASDGNSGTDTVTLSVTIEGRNDNPVITEANSTDGILLEVSITDMDIAHDNTPAAVNDATDGNFAATDVDTGDTITWSRTVASINTAMTTGIEFDGRTVSDFGVLTITDANTGAWEFTPTVAINELDTGQSVVIDYTIQAEDSNSGTDTSILRVTLNGVNDSPTLTPSAAAPAEGYFVVEDSSTSMVNGVLTVADADMADTVASLTVIGVINGQTNTLNTQPDAGMISSDADIYAITGSNLEIAGEYGKFVLTRDNTNGQIAWSYEIDEMRANSLDENAKPTETLSLRVWDDDGLASSIQTISVEVRGADDALVFDPNNRFSPFDVVDPSRPVTNDAPTTTGTFSASDPDDAIIWSATPTGANSGLGTVTFSGNAWTFELTSGPGGGVATLNGLASGDTRPITFDISANGVDAGTPLTITLKGAMEEVNVAPTLTTPAGGYFVEEDSSTSPSMVNDTLTVADTNVADTVATLTVIGVINGQANTLNTQPDAGMISSDADIYAITGSNLEIAGRYGKFVLTLDNTNGRIEWRYEIDETLANSLDENATPTETLLLRAWDDDGLASSIRTISVEVRGADDATTITSTSGSGDFGPFEVVDPSRPATNDAPTATGTFSATDPDDSTISWSATPTGPNSGLGTVTFSGNAWTFELTSGPAGGVATLNGLARGNTTDITFTITANGVDADTPLRITLRGANEEINVAPTLTTPAGGYFVEEDSSTSTSMVSDTLTVADTNMADTVANLTVIGVINDGANALDTQPDAGMISSDADIYAITGSDLEIAGEYGKFVLTRDNTNGQIRWRYEIDETLANSLDETEMPTERLSLRAWDDDGLASSIRTISVEVRGADDAPVFDANNRFSPFEVVDPSRTVTTDAPMTIGTFSATDPDDDIITWLATPTGPNSGLGTVTFSGNEWTFELTSGPGGGVATLNGLASGDMEEITFTITANGVNAGTPLTITLKGAAEEPNVAPTLTTPAGGYFVVEDSSTSMVNDTLTVADTNVADTVATLTVIGVINGQTNTLNTQPDAGMISSDADIYAITGSNLEIAGEYGKFVLTLDNTNGRIEWRYEIDETLANSLDETEMPTETLSLRAWDDDGLASSIRTISVEVRGADDAPVFDANNRFSPFEVVDPSRTVTTDAPMTTGTFSATDPDDDIITWLATPTGPNSGLGTVTFSGNAWTFELTSGPGGGVATLNGLASGDMEEITFTITANGVNAGTPLTITLKGATATVDNPATAIALTATTVTTVAEGTSTRVKVADIVITDDGGSPGTLELAGTNPNLFEIDLPNLDLYLKSGQSLDFETLPTLNVRVQLMGNPGVSSSNLTIDITNVDEGQAGFNVTSTGNLNAAAKDHVLTVERTTPDPDGDGTFRYQWQRNGANIDGATNMTYTIVEADEGTDLTVDVMYTDGGGKDETVTTSGVSVPVPDAPPEIRQITAETTNGYYHLPATGQVEVLNHNADADGLNYSVNNLQTPDIIESRETTTTTANFLKVTIDENGIWKAIPTKEIPTFSSSTGIAERNFYIHAHDTGGTHLGSQLIEAPFNKMNIVRTDGNSGSSENEFFIGTTGDDNFSRTGGGTDVIVALEGDDTIRLGRATSDTIYHRFSSSDTSWVNTDGGDTITNFNRNVNTFIFVDTDSSVVSESQFISSPNIRFFATIQTVISKILITKFEIRFSGEGSITFEYNAGERPDVTGRSDPASLAFLGTTNIIVNGTREITNHNVWSNYFGTNPDAFQVIGIDDDDLPPLIADLL